MLRAIGYFIDSFGTSDFPAPQELVGADSRLEAVADYLDRGLVYRRYRGFSWCRFSCGEEEMGSCDLTDGRWVWPEGLSHYLRVHSVLLPEELMQHAVSGAPIVPAPKADEPDDSFWLEWAHPRRLDSLRQRIEHAQGENLRLADLARNEAIRAALAKYGEGSDKCLWSGCWRRALSGMVFCANHLPEITQKDHLQLHSSRLLRDALRGDR